MIYRTDRYQTCLQKVAKAKANRDRIVKNSEVLASTTKLTSKQQEKQTTKKKVAEDDVVSAQAMVGACKQRVNLIAMAVQFFQYRYLSSHHFGKVVAVLPLEPWGLFGRVTQRGLAGVEEYPSACGWFLVYFLCNFALKPTLNSVLGWVRGEEDGGKGGGFGAMMKVSEEQGENA